MKKIDAKATVIYFDQLDLPWSTVAWSSVIYRDLPWLIYRDLPWWIQLSSQWPTQAPRNKQW